MFTQNYLLSGGYGSVTCQKACFVHFHILLPLILISSLGMFSEWKNISYVCCRLARVGAHEESRTEILILVVVVFLKPQIRLDRLSRTTQK